MSIIERALGKLRSSARRGDAPHQQQRSAAARPVITSMAARATPRSAPSESIALDTTALRAAGFLAPEELHERLTAQFRRIKWPLLESMLRRASPSASIANSVMITSSIAGEGKTFVTFNLALSLAREQDLEVLLIDADLGKRHLTRQLMTDERRGLTDAIVDPALDPGTLILGTGVRGLTFLPAGQRTSVATELFASARMAELVTALGRSDPGRIVLFDSSPLLATSEAQVLSHLVDQVLLVVRAESTLQPAVLESIALLDKSKAIRCLLNQVRSGVLAEYYDSYGASYGDAAHDVRAKAP
jgi:protein-tyrosine kinase